MSRMKAIVFDFIQNQIYTNQEQVNGLTTKQVAEALNLQRRFNWQKPPSYIQKIH